MVSFIISQTIFPPEERDRKDWETVRLFAYSHFFITSLDIWHLNCGFFCNKLKIRQPRWSHRLKYRFVVNLMKTFRHQYSNISIKRSLIFLFFIHLFYLSIVKIFAIAYFANALYVSFETEMWVNLITTSVTLTLIVVSFPFWYRGRKWQKESGKKCAYNRINEHIIKLHRKPFTRIQLRPSMSRKMINANKDKWVRNI